MTIREFPEKILVSYISTHSAHESEIQHIPLSTPEKAIVRKKLTDGVPSQRIHQEIVSNIGPELNRVDLLTMQDIRNQSNKIDSRPWKLHPIDMISVHRWVSAENEKGNESSVLAFKPIGRKSVLYGEELNTQDFLLCIQTPSQKSLLDKLGEGRPLLMDSTHNTNIAAYKLIVIMVIDHHNEGVPVSFCIAKQESFRILQIFFSSLKQRCRSISPSCIMRDDAPQFYNAFISVFSAKARKLLCIWHVWRAWNRNSTSIEPKPLRDTIKRKLQNLQRLSDSTLFEVWCFIIFPLLFT